MNGTEAAGAVKAARAILEESELDVQAIVLHAAVLDPNDDHFDYMVVSYPNPSEVEPQVRKRIFEALVKTAEAYGFAPEGEAWD